MTALLVLAAVCGVSLLILVGLMLTAPLDLAGTHSTPLDQEAAREVTG